MKNPINVKQGKKNRAAGKRFERKVRENLVKDGWIVVRFDQQVEFDKMLTLANGEKVDGQKEIFEGKLVVAKSKFNPFYKRAIMSSGGFPDFVCFKTIVTSQREPLYQRVQFVECKKGKYLSAEEKQKAKWLEDNLKIPFFVATPGGKRGQINFLKLNFTGG